MTLRLPGRDPVAFEVEPFARYRLLNGIDEFSYLLSQSAAIDAFERERERVKARIAVLPGDGVGPEVTAEAVRALRAVGRAIRP